MLKDENKVAKTLNDKVKSFEKHNSVGKIKGILQRQAFIWHPSNKTSVLNDIPIKIIKNLA